MLEAPPVLFDLELNVLHKFTDVILLDLGRRL